MADRAVDDMIFLAVDWIEWLIRRSRANGSIGVGRGSNDVPAHFTLTFTVLDRILTTFTGHEGKRTHCEIGFLVAFGSVSMDMDIGVYGGAT